MEQAVRNVAESPQRKFSLNGDLWRQDDKSERSVRDKIAMFSSQSNLDAPLFPNAMTAAAVAATSNGKRLSKYKSSEDVCCDDRNNQVPRDRSSFFADRTQSSFDLTDSARATATRDSATKYGSQRTPSLPQPAVSGAQTARVPKTSLPIVPPKIIPSIIGSSYDKQILSSAKTYCASASSESGHSRNVTSYSPSLVAGDKASNGNVKTAGASSLTRAVSFSGCTMPFAQDRSCPMTIDPVGNSPISRTNSLASTFRRSSAGEDARRSCLNQLIEQRRKSMSKLRGLVIPEKDTVPVERSIVDLPEIKSRDSILHQVRSEINIVEVHVHCT